jgi:hypothetical protein
MGSGQRKLSLAGVVLLIAGAAQAEAPRSRAQRRNVIPAEETRGAPPGFHAERRPRYGPIIGGSITAGIGALFLAAGIDQRIQSQRRVSAVPAIPGGGGEFLMICGGLSLAAGIPLLTYGLLSPRKVYARDSVAASSLSLSLNPRNPGASLKVTF